MRVGILTQYYPPEMGAPQARLSDLARYLDQEGHQVVVVTAMPNYPTGRVFDGYRGFSRREKASGVEIIRTYVWPTKATGLMPRLASYGSFAVSSLASVRSVRRLDVLITESPPLLLGPSGWLLSRVWRARWVFNVSDLWPDSAIRMGALSHPLAQRLAYAIESVCYRRSWGVSGQSKEILADIGARFPDVRLHHFSNGVDTERFSPARRSTEVRQHFLSGADVSVVYAGLHGLAQGLEHVLIAAESLRDRSDVHFSLVGDGPTKGRLRREAAERRLDNVSFRDPLAKGDMPALLASADIAVVPLATELPGAVPSKLYEAMASGVPVVLAATGEAAAIVEGAGAGIVVPPGDAAGIEKAVRRLADDERLRQTMGEAGRRASVDLYDREQACRGFVAWLTG